MPAMAKLEGSGTAARVNCVVPEIWYVTPAPIVKSYICVTEAKPVAGTKTSPVTLGLIATDCRPLLPTGVVPDCGPVVTVVANSRPLPLA